MASTLGVQRATVVTSQDPAGKGRLRLRVPELFGDVPTDWVDPSIPGGMIPAPGTTVWIFFQGGNVQRPVYISGSPTPDLSGYATVAALAALSGTVTTLSGTVTANQNQIGSDETIFWMSDI